MWIANHLLDDLLVIAKAVNNKMVDITLSGVECADDASSLNWDLYLSVLAWGTKSRASTATTRTSRPPSTT